MSIEQMRSWLKKQYGSADKWVSRVNQMPDAQVMAIYFRMTDAKHK